MAQVRTRKRGKTWSYIFEAGKVDGRRKVVEKGGYATKAEAYRAGVEKYNDYLHGNIGITSESITLKNFMTAWLENVVSANVKATSLQLYKSLANNQILPNLGEINVQKLTPAILDKWIRARQQAGLSQNTLRHMYTLLRQALDYAVYPAEFISSNPAAYIKVPKNAPRNVVKRTIISGELLRELLIENPLGTSFHIPILLLFCTGIRIGELLGLTWDDIDFEKKIISIRRQMIYISKRGQIFAPPKSKSGIRNIFIGDALVDVLKKWKELQKSNEIAYGDAYVCVYGTRDNVVVFQSRGAGILDLQRVKFVCTQPDGKLLNRRSFMRLLKNKGINAHSFRHTHATILAESGALPKAVAGRLGHSKIHVTQDLYVHNTQKMQEGLAVIFDKTLQTK